MSRRSIALLVLISLSIAAHASTVEVWRTEARRAEDRAACAPVKLASAAADHSPRQTVDLAGKWLFKPSQEMSSSEIGANPTSSDSSWHVLDVPQFWTPVRWASYDGRTSYNHQIREKERTDRFTFDAKGTKSGWYRRWIEIPASMKGRRFILRFDAVANVSEVYWNGRHVGGHVGMFAPFECEVTPHVRFGQKNLVAVFVSLGKTDPEAAKQVVGTEVTVDITKDMLNNLPHGFFFHELMGGIWQPVTLEITGRDRISDVYFRPRLDGASIEATVDRRGAGPLEVRQTITDAASGAVLHRDAKGVAVPEGSGVIHSEIRGLKPRLWSPEHPNLYLLKTQLVSGRVVVDEEAVTVGFRTFQVRGNRVYLNGKPYFMRGANEPPIGITACDKALANKFMKFMHDGNEMMTRFHGNPVGQTWLDAADHQGVGVSVEGHWPWLMTGNNPIPAAELLQSWKDEWLTYVRAYRNHPSVLMFTMNNENYFNGAREPDAARKTEKYRNFSDLVKATRAIAGDRPIVFFSGYQRSEDDYSKVVVPNGFDDGDMDDRHCYSGWYSRSLFQLDVGRDIEGAPSAWNRPLISQEHGLPYSDADTGHCLKDYQIKASAWIGQNAFYSARPDMFLEFQGRMIKETAEKIRRDKTRISGWSLFCNFCWFKDAYIADTITPFPVYWDVKKAWSPVLVSLQSADRHFMAGEKFTSAVYVMNDDMDQPYLRDLTLEWRIYGKSTADESVSSGAVPFPDCRYYDKSIKEIEFEVPRKLPLDRSDMTLELTLLQGRQVVSRNTYPLVCAMPAWCAVKQDVTVLENDPSTSAYLSGIGARCESAAGLDWSAADPKKLIVIAAGVDASKLGASFAKFLAGGGRVLVLEPSESTLKAIPGVPADHLQVIGAAGEFVDVQRPELLDGMDPMDTHWLNAMPGDVVRVCRTSYQLPDSPVIAKYAVHGNPHGYIPPDAVTKQFSWPVFEVKSGRGRALVSSILLADDPVAKRFMCNALRFLSREKEQSGEINVP